MVKKSHSGAEKSAQGCVAVWPKVHIHTSGPGPFFQSCHCELKWTEKVSNSWDGNQRPISKYCAVFGVEKERKRERRILLPSLFSLPLSPAVPCPLSLFFSLSHFCLETVKRKEKVRQLADSVWVTWLPQWRIQWQSLISCSVFVCVVCKHVLFEGDGIS